MFQFICNNLDTGYTVLSLFLDFSKAFDGVDHIFLLLMVNVYGVSGIALIWFQSYLNERLHYVSSNGNNSDYLTMSSGVCQGSILAHCFFWNTLTIFLKVLFYFNFNLYADYSTLSIRYETYQSICFLKILIVNYYIITFGSY